MQRMDPAIDSNRIGGSAQPDTGKVEFENLTEAK